MEAAAVARLKELNVIIVEKSERILKRVACEHTSDFFRDLHQKNGVQIVEGCGLDHFTQKNGKISGAVLED